MTPREVRIELGVDALATRLGLDAPGNDATVQIISPVRLTRTGMAVRLVHTDGRAATSGTPDPALVKLILQARTWWARLATGETDMSTIARTEGINDSWVSRVVRLNFLALTLIDQILAGIQPARLTATALLGSRIDADWNCQREVIFDR